MNKKKIPTLESVICLVCQEILIKPIRLPCAHTVCLECLEKICEHNNLTCPMCRKRLSIFLRRNKDLTRLVDEKLWEDILVHFKEEVDRKLAGQDDGVWDSVVLSSTTPCRQMYTPGELNEEYKRLEAEARAERQRQEEEERLQSMMVIEQLEREEEERLRKEEEERILREKEDEEFAKKLAQMEQDEELTVSTRSRVSLPSSVQAPRSRGQTKRKSTSSTGSSTTGPLDMFCIRTTSPTMFAIQTPVRTKSKSAQKRKSTVEGPLDRFYTRGGSATKRRCTTSPSPCCSTDSIDCEMNYFKPIKLVPRTPPKCDDVIKPIIVQPKFSPSSSVNASLGTVTSDKSGPRQKHGPNPRTLFSSNPLEDTTVDVEMTSLDSSVTQPNSTNLDNAHSFSTKQNNCTKSIGHFVSPNSTPIKADFVSPTNSPHFSPSNTVSFKSQLKKNSEPIVVFNSPSHWSRSPAISLNLNEPVGRDQKELAVPSDNSASIETAIRNLSTVVKTPTFVPANRTKTDSLNNNTSQPNITNPLRQDDPKGARERSGRRPNDNQTSFKPVTLFQTSNLSNINSTYTSSKRNPTTDKTSSTGQLGGSSVNVNGFAALNADRESFPVDAESLRNKREIEHFFAEFKKISLSQTEDEVCFSQMLRQGVPLPRRSRRCYVQSDEETDVEDFFPSPRKPAATVVK